MTLCCYNPDFSPGDAPSLVFLPPAGTCSLRPSLGATLRAAIAVQIVCPDDLSLNRTNLSGADLDDRRSPEGCAPRMGRINYGYALGRRHPLAAQTRPERIWTLEECPERGRSRDGARQKSCAIFASPGEKSGLVSPCPVELTRDYITLPYISSARLSC